MSTSRAALLSFTETRSSNWVASPVACGHVSLGRWIAGRLSRLAGGRGGAGRATAYHPECDLLESKMLLSGVLSWSGGSAGNTDSAITPANISTLQQQFSKSLDGEILAEPLTATVDVTVGPEHGIQELVFAATEADTLYAFNLSTGQLVWQTSFLKPGETAVPFDAVPYNVNGITGTPVIDQATNTIYVVSAESYVVGNITHHTKTLHAIDMSDGTERPGSPATIADTGYNSRGKAVSTVGPSVRGTGAGVKKGRVQFYAQLQLQRVGLSIVGNNVVIGFGSYGDIPPEHGWILAYDKDSLQLTGVFNDTPNGSDGGIWNSGGPIQTDSQGYLYTETGNGTYDTRLNRAGFPSRGDYGDTVLKLAIDPGYKGPTGTGIRVVDYFTPSNQAKLEKGDGDLASSGVLILPDGSGGPSQPNLLLASGKQGTIYVINRDRMGHFRKGSNNIVETVNGAITGSFDTPGIFDGTVYYAGTKDFLKAFKLVNGQLQETGQALDSLPYPGANPVVSSDGTQNGIVWVISASNQLIAYDPANLASKLWTANLPDYSHFSIPAITDDGHVLVGAGSSLVGFGLGGG